MLMWIWLATALVALALYLRQAYSRFRGKGVKYDFPVPILGNMATVVLKMEHIADSISKSYNAFPHERFFGRYDFMTPLIVLRDLEMVKIITVKDFEHFTDHRSVFSDPLFIRNLFSLTGQEWKEMRSTLSPAFTSSKMRLMVPFMVEVGDQMILSLKKQMKDSSTDFVDVDCKDLTTRYANDVIASCAFGLKVDSQSEKDNQFYEMGKNTSTFTNKQLLLFFFTTAFPKLKSKLNIQVFSGTGTRFFKDLVLDTMQEREKRNIIRPDMIHLLMEAKKGRLTYEEKSTEDEDAGFATVEESFLGKKKVNRVWTDDDLVSQAVLFFIAGFETVSSSMTFLLHELAANSEVQERLAQEVRDTDAKNGGKFDFNSIQQMTYMDMVVSEVLRRWPPAVATDRLCVKEYNMGKPNEEATEDYIIHKGEGLFIPIWGFHHDPQFFPDPQKFDPERFSDENKHKIKPLSYMPFGIGPRNCIGSRFALCEVKVITYQILRYMELSPGPNSCVPVELDRKSFQLRPKGGFHVRFRIRE